MRFFKLPNCRRCGKPYRNHDRDYVEGFTNHQFSPEDFPEIICICGSTKFKAEFETAVKELGLQGKIVLNVACYGRSGDLPPEQMADGHPVKTMLDELHKRKIDLADSIYVVNVGGYIGTSTRSEINYAEKHGKTVVYLEPLQGRDALAEALSSKGETDE